MYKQLYFFILTTIILMGNVACEKENTTIDIEPKLNSFRVKKITGKNDIWGEYTIEFTYNSQGRITKSYRTAINSETEKLDTLGYALIDKKDNGLAFFMADYIINIDADSIAKLKQEFPESYADTLKKRRTLRTVYQNGIQVNTENQITEEITNIFKCREDFGSGTQFNNSYLNKSRNTYKYEYNATGQVTTTRYYEDVYNLESDKNDKYTRRVCKAAFTYNNNEVVKIDMFHLDAESSEHWILNDTWHYVYTNNSLIEVQGNNFNYKRIGNNINIQRNNLLVTYTLNDYNLPIRVEANNDEYMDIEYEAGHGEFSIYASTWFDELIGIPTIK
ncbi:MAG: hypothetical protein ACRDDZ_03445 [Marinifilaceae bacterium]